MTTIRNMQTGLIPYPKRIDISARTRAQKINHTGMDRIGKRIIKGACWHRGLTGNQSFPDACAYLQNPSVQGLVDYYIDHRTGEMAALIGDVGQADDMTPWAQGPWAYSTPSDDAKAFMARYEAASGMGVSVWNGWLRSLEVTGDGDTPISNATKATMIQYQAALSHDLGGIGSDFPIGKDGLTLMFGHREGCGTAYKLCPFTVVWDYINSKSFISAVGDLMDSYQLGHQAPSLPSGTVKPETQYAPAQLPDFLRDMLAGKKVVPSIDEGGTRFVLVTDQYRAIRPTPRLQYGLPEAPRVGPDMKDGEDANISFVFTSTGDGKLYGLSSWGTRFSLDDFERTSDVPAKS